MPKSNFLGTSDVARELGVSQRWVNNLLNDGKLKGIYVGNRWLITREDLEKYIASQKGARRK